jgi:hypothetical protein
VRRVDREHVLAARLRQLERLLELRKTRSRQLRRPRPAAALEQHSRVGPAEPFRLVQQHVALPVAPAQALDPRQLRHHLRATRIRRLLLQLRTEAALARVEVVEIPQRTKPVSHRRQPTIREGAALAAPSKHSAIRSGS